MIAMCVFLQNTPESSSSGYDGVYESGTKAYSSEEILKILLNPKIDPNRICRTSPSSIKQSAACVVDLDCLDHPDAVKKDEFGKWNYSGSHVFHYRSERTPEGDLEFERVLSGMQGSNVFQLCRIHCKHPSNPNFQRLLAFVTGTYVECFSVHVCVYVHAQLLLKSQLPYSVLYCTVLYCGSTF